MTCLVFNYAFVTLSFECVCSCRSLFRRHADGTYTSDVSSYLQDQAAKEFVSWLKTGRGRRDWTPTPAVAVLENNAAIFHWFCAIRYVSQSVLLFHLVMLLKSPHKKPCRSSVVEGNAVENDWSAVGNFIRHLLFSHFVIFIFWFTWICQKVSQVTFLTWTGAVILTVSVFFSCYTHKSHLVFSKGMCVIPEFPL